MSTTIEQFIEQAWNDHAGDLRGVAERMPQAAPLLQASPHKAGDFALLAEHVFIEHLGDAPAMAAWLEVLGPMAQQHADAAGPVRRARLATALLRGESGDGAGLPVASVIRAHGAAAGGSALRGEVVRARSLMDQAAALERAAADADQPAAGKALAACCNNLATLLLDQAREPQRDALMLDMARLSRSTWGRAGTWLNAERGDYVLALCHAALGEGAAAVRHATDCLATCEANAADAFERFFAHEAMSRALAAAHDTAGAATHRRHMQDLLPQIDDEGNRACAASTLAQLA